MKLLIITQNADSADQNLGFFVDWIETFAKWCEQVMVVCLEEGEHYFPQNVRVLSLGKNRLKIPAQTSPERSLGGQVRFKLGRKLLYAFRLVRYIVLERGEYDCVFVHMNPEYALIGGVFWILFGKRVALWYVHKKVSWRLRLAEKFVDKIFTASKESCRLRSGKVEIVGHGIDIETRIHVDTDADSRGYKTKAERASGFHLLTVGRISPVKDLGTLILGFAELLKSFPEASFSIIGEPITYSDRLYRDELSRGFPKQVRFLRGVSHQDLPRFFKEANVFVHASKTGSMDKAVLEALASGLSVFTSSEAFTEDMGVRKFRQGDAADFAEKLGRAFLRKELVINEKGSAYVIKYHSLGRLIQKILAFYV